jgi:hypothetical protein
VCNGGMHAKVSCGLVAGKDSLAGFVGQFLFCYFMGKTI